MSIDTLNLESQFVPDRLAAAISTQYQSWNTQRQKWLSEKRELRSYVFATDTTTTSNSKLPWKNSTTTPKLCQIRDNLHANYMAALFPHEDWLRWEAADRDSAEAQKRKDIEDYMKNKSRLGDLRTIVSSLIYDYIDYGNVFAIPEWVNESKTDPITGEEKLGFIGPKIRRIAPEDIVFNPLSVDFKSSPKIVRSVTTLGDLKKRVENTEDVTVKETFNLAMEKAINARRYAADADESDLSKIERLSFDGFGTLKEYYGSGLVEVLTFYGDIYDLETEELLQDYIITIVDRSYIASKIPNPSGFRHGGIHHVGWRLRQENLYAMGPLDNLVGMQYRIDHLENLKADVFDLIAFPVIKRRGFVDDFEYAPGAIIDVGEEGDVEFMRPDATALNADTQIQILENKMEEMAGAPKQAMGFRTPGEKTAYEVQTLENAASRIFQNKVQHFENVFLNPILNDMLDLARLNMTGSDVVRTLDSETSAEIFRTVTQADIVANGRLVPQGAARFARKAQIMQNLTALMGSPIGQDPAVNVHISGYETAKLVENLLELEEDKLVSENIRVAEQAETQRTMNTISQQLEDENMIRGENV